MGLPRGGAPPTKVNFARRCRALWRPLHRRLLLLCCCSGRHCAASASSSSPTEASVQDRQSELLTGEHRWFLSWCLFLRFENLWNWETRLKAIWWKFGRQMFWMNFLPFGPALTNRREWRPCFLGRQKPKLLRRHQQGSQLPEETSGKKLKKLSCYKLAQVKDLRCQAAKKSIYKQSQKCKEKLCASLLQIFQSALHWRSKRRLTDFDCSSLSWVSWGTCAGVFWAAVGMFRKQKTANNWLLFSVWKLLR